MFPFVITVIKIDVSSTKLHRNVGSTCFCINTAPLEHIQVSTSVIRDYGLVQVYFVLFYREASATHNKHELLILGLKLKLAIRATHQEEGLTPRHVAR